MRSWHQQSLERLHIGREDIEADLMILWADKETDYLLSMEKERSEILIKIAAKSATKELPSTADVKTQWKSDTEAEGSSTPKETKVKLKTHPDKATEDHNLSLKELTISNKSNSEPHQEKLQSVSES